MNDDILSGLAIELREVGLITHLDCQGGGGRIRICSPGVNAGQVTRINIYHDNGQLLIFEACGNHQMASQRPISLADPNSIELLITYATNRIEYWTKWEQRFGAKELSAEAESTLPRHSTAGSWFDPLD